MAFLVRPSVAYKESFLEGLREFQAEGRYYQAEKPERLAQEFENFVQKLLGLADKAKVAPGWVAESIFWLVEKNEFVGRISIRHELNDRLLLWGGHIGYEIRPSKRGQGYGREILRLGLEKAKELGLSKVLVTCDADNTGSRKIIEHNGGQLENEVEVEMRGELSKKRRYWIEIE